MYSIFLNTNRLLESLIENKMASGFERKFKVDIIVYKLEEKSKLGKNLFLK